MPTALAELLANTWRLAAEMAPYLLMGFSAAGLLRVYFTEAWVQRHLGQRGMGQIAKAVLVGIPLPLCSCGVIAVAAGIRKQGGQRGAVAAFTASTPQTGVDSIAATVGMLGWPFAVMRVLLAFISGLLAGWVVERIGDKPGSNASATGPSCCGGGTAKPESPAPAASCCSGSKAPGNAAPQLRWMEGLRFGFITLPADLALALLVGLSLAGVIATFAPADLFTNIPGGLFGLYLGMTLLALPLYVCSTASIPMAFTFLAAGMSPGAVLIFLVAGPASTMATVTALIKIIGGRATVAYVSAIVATTWVAAAAVDIWKLPLLPQVAPLHIHAHGPGMFAHAAAVILMAVLLLAVCQQKRPAKSQ